MKIFSAEYFQDLSSQAQLSPRKRQHRNIHEDFSDPCQRMFNAIEPHSYIRPHRHAEIHRDETLIVVRGSMALFAFDDQGNTTYVLQMGSYQAESDHPLGVEVPSHVWHTVIALEPGTVLLEIKAGPYDPSLPRECPLWAPEESSPHVAAYMGGLLKRFREQSNKQ